MPFRVKFQIFEPGKVAPCFTSTDRKLANVEYRHRCNQQGCALTRMTYEIECIDLTQPEKYVWLVYGVRQAIKKYFTKGRKHDDLMASVALEKQLDDWNVRTRTYLNNHPNCQVDEKGKAFFLIVEAWRNKWHKYFACKKNNTEPQQILDQMKRECFDYEKQIDNYVNEVIGL